ncbi:DUF362 domain-containing protein [Chloroflexota bacterium]
MSSTVNAKEIVFFTTDLHLLPHAMIMCGLERFVGESVPIKLHMGEPGNPYIIQPALARVVASGITSAGGSPFLTDTTVAYPGERSHKKGYERVAQRHGFTPERVDCSAIIDDEGVRVVEAGVALEVAVHMHAARCMVVLSHVKGHIQAGFGGAIKNLGMGGVTRASKRRIHHMAVPVHDAALCTLCGECAKVCPVGAIEADTEWRIDRGECEGCGKCVLVCAPHALRVEVMSLAEGLAISARACTRDKTVIYVNSLHDLAEGCDCDPNPGRIICPDIGYVVGTDAAAVDAASLDLVDEIRPGVFKQRTRVDPRPQVTYAVEYGMNADYVLERL